MGQMDKVEAELPILPPTLKTQPFPEKKWQIEFGHWLASWAESPD